MPRFVSPLASIRQLSSMTTSSPMRILCGCRSTTFCPKTTLRPHEPSSSGYSVLRSARPSAPGHLLRQQHDQLVPRSAPQPGAADHQRGVFLRGPTCPASNSWSCARGMDAGRRAQPALSQSQPSARYQSSVRRMPSRSADPRREAELGARARDVERAALREEVDAPAIERRLDAERRADRFAQRSGDPERPHRQVQPRRRHAALPRRSARPARSASSLPRRRGCRCGRPRPAPRRTAGSPRRDRRCRSDDRRSSPSPRIDESPPRDAAKQLQQPAIAWAVDAGRPRDDDLDAGAARRPRARLARLRAW